MHKKLDLYEIGYLFKRKDIHKLSLADLTRELYNHLFEATIIKLAIEEFWHKKIKFFDSSVGDWKCQVRTSILVDFSQNIHLIHHDLHNNLKKINTIIDNIFIFLNKLNCLNSVECQTFSRKQLHNLSLMQLLEQNHILYTPTQEITTLGLCFLTTLNNRNLPVFLNHKMSINKFKDIINQAKSKLCHTSINYEQDLADDYFLLNEQQLLHQVEFKGMQHMTSLFAGFKPIFKKMKALEQPFLTTTTIFCQCGGVQINRNDFYEFKNKEYTRTTIPKDHDQVTTIIDVYQYPGSLTDLQHKLKIESKATDIPHEFRKDCTCKNSSKEQPIKSIDEAIMAFFAQHPQFTNGAEINWKGLGLENSELKKEYDYLLTLPGFSRENMSIFHINHMYASTIADVLKEQEEMKARLQAEKN